MELELIRLAAGLVIAAFHRQIADYVMHHERVLVGLCRERGVTLPDVPSTEIARNIYFGLGIFIAVFELMRIWTLLP